MLIGKKNLCLPLIKSEAFVHEGKYQELLKMWKKKYLAGLREKCWVNNKTKAKEVLKLSSSSHREVEGCSEAKEGKTQRRQLSVQTKRKAQYKIKSSGRIGQATGRNQGEMAPYIISRYLHFYLSLIKIYGTKLICIFINAYALSSDIGSAQSLYQCVLCLCLTWNWHITNLAYKERGKKTLELHWMQEIHSCF